MDVILHLQGGNDDPLFASVGFGKCGDARRFREIETGKQQYLKKDTGRKAMSEESIKLSRVKRSCKTIKTVTRIIGIIGIVATMIALISGSVILSNAKKFEEEFHKAEATADPGKKDGKLEIKVMNVEAVHVETDIVSPSFVNFVDNLDLQSTNPKLQEYLDNYPISFVLGCYLIFVSLLVAVFTVVMHLISKTFELMEKEDTPFTKRVAKRLLIIGIVLSAGFAMAAGIGIGAVGGLLTWVVYTIMDYGVTLQTQADETL